MPKAIMVVNDSEADQFIIENMVGKLDREINLQKCWDGEEAIELIKELEESTDIPQDKMRPAMIFLDINMPRMNGFEFLEEYSKYITEKSAEAIPVVMFTSSGEDVDRERAHQYEFVRDYAVKPITIESLETLLKAMILLH